MLDTDPSPLPWPQNDAAPPPHSGGVAEVRDPQTGLPQRLVDVTRDTPATKTQTHVTRFTGRHVGPILIAVAPVPQHPGGEGSLRIQGARETHPFLEFPWGLVLQILYLILQGIKSHPTGVWRNRAPNSKGTQAAPLPLSNTLGSRPHSLTTVGRSCSLQAKAGLEPTAFRNHPKCFPQQTTPPLFPTQGQFGRPLAALTQMQDDTPSETPVRRKPV